MPELPWRKWFPQDWLSDPGVTVCSPATRGIWADAICSMMLSCKYEIHGTPEALSRICRCSADEFMNAVDELCSTGSAEVEKQDGSIIVTNRRMKREANISEIRRKAGKSPKSTRNKHEAKVQASSASASASASASLNDFMECWSLYPDKKGKASAEKAYRNAVKSGTTQGEVLSGLNRYIAYVRHRRKTDFADLKFQNGGTWFYQHGWEDEYTIPETEVQARQKETRNVERTREIKAVAQARRDGVDGDQLKRLETELVRLHGPEALEESKGYDN